MNTLKCKKSVVTALILVMLMILANQTLSAARQRRGATVEVTLSDGSQIKGELLAVKGSDLIIHEQPKNQGFTVNIGHVSGIRIKKKSRVLSGMAIGFINGMAAGVIIGRSRDDGDGGERAGAAIVGLMCWGAATVIGAMTGAFISLPEEMPTNGKEPVQVNSYLRHLQKHARY